MLAVLHVLGFSLEQIFDMSQNQALLSGRENWSLLLPLFTGSAVTELIMTNLWLIVVVASVRGDWECRGPVWVFQAFLDYFNAVVIESIRAFASVLRWVPALLIPAFVRYLQLIFVPYIVVTNPAYQTGQVDALKCSRQITRGHLTFLTLSLLLTIMVPYFLGNVLHKGNDSVFQNPGPALLWGALTLFINLYCSLFLFSIFENLSTKVSIGGAHADFQLERHS